MQLYAVVSTITFDHGPPLIRWHAAGEFACMDALMRNFPKLRYDGIRRIESSQVAVIVDGDYSEYVTQQGGMMGNECEAWERITKQRTENQA